MSTGYSGITPRLSIWLEANLQPGRAVARETKTLSLGWMCCDDTGDPENLALAGRTAGARWQPAGQFNDTHHNNSDYRSRM